MNKTVKNILHMISLLNTITSKLHWVSEYTGLQVINHIAELYILFIFVLFTASFAYPYSVFFLYFTSINREYIFQMAIDYSTL